MFMYLNDYLEEQLSGIFVRSISEDGAADRCGKIKLNDQIIEVRGPITDGCN